ncbi:carbohydrate ABC transporter permease [Ruminococcaceae bacterium OttesenSCG-928-L11]|nr:carbohydrate ABC transporter permease [Ruminococcaceae bacterium OttesenSCG-928-L11]
MNRFRNTRSDYVFDGLVALLLIAIAIAVAYPLYFMIIASVSDPVYTNSGQVLLYPKGFSLAGYQRVFRDSRLLTGYRNTILYSFGFMALSLCLNVLAAYPLSNRSLVGRRLFSALFLIPMYFGGGLIPTYIVVRNIGMINKPAIICILGAMSAFYIIITRTFFENSIPPELHESAAIDGANQIQVFFRIVLPLAKPILAVLALYAFVQQWNAYFNAMMYLNDSKYYPLQLVLREILIMAQSVRDSQTEVSIESLNELAQQQKLADMIKYGVIVVSSAPLLAIFPFFQKYFAQGIMVGAVKG